MTYLSLITVVHTLLSVVAIPLGVLAMVALFRAGAVRWAIPWLLCIAALTSVTGFLFPFKGMTPAIATGIVTVITLTVALLASYRFRLAGVWRWIYAVSLVVSLYLLVFVGIVQAFLKIGFLHRFAPKGSEPPFAAAQLLALCFFLSLGILAVRRFRPEAATQDRTSDRIGREARLRVQV